MSKSINSSQLEAVQKIWNPLGLYIHVPYCAFLCHYCDFAKTANFSQDTIDQYFKVLLEHLRGWMQALGNPPLQSVFLGGGTPGMFRQEWEPVFEWLAGYLEDNAEVTIETNPHDIKPESLRTWRNLGINRLSIGVQTLQADGLEFLTRQHSTEDARRAITLAQRFFDNVNVDLIYGWTGQDLNAWSDDLLQVSELGVPHLSLYCLTFEKRTPLGRKFLRGSLRGLEDDLLASMYEHARTFLRDRGYDQDEVSNWAKKGYDCQHNWRYWNGESYLGVGAGAHSFLRGDALQPGWRFAYARNDRQFVKTPAPTLESVCRMLAGQGLLGLELDKRETSDLAWELIACGLRTRRGCPWETVQALTNQQFSPTPMVVEGLQAGIVRIENGRLMLDPTEWFRENAWIAELAQSIGL